jgi:hypothetical protein
MPDKLNITELDFDTIKNNLVTYFTNVTDEKGQKPYKDYDFQGSALNTLMSILAYNTHYNAMTAHMAVNETFIDSAQLRSSVVSAAKLLGYVPRSATSSRVDASVVITATPTNNSYSLPDSLYLDRNTTFKVSSLYKVYYYTLKDGATFSRVSGTSTYTLPLVNNVRTKLSLVEGQRVTKRYPINGAYDYEKYVIDDENIDMSSLIVRVYPNPNDTDNAIEYARYENISQTSADAALYYVAENSLGKFEITFGNGIISRKPNPLSVLELEYIVTNGLQANGAGGLFSLVSNPFQNTPQIAYSFAINVDGPSSGGSDRESIDEVRSNATSGFVSQNRAVTADDYNSIIVKEFPIIKSVSIWGGEDNDPPQYGKVFISPSKEEDDEEADVLTDSEKKQLMGIIASKKVIAIIPEIVNAERINIVLDVLFKYNSNITTSSKSELENNLRASVITDYNNTQLKGFGKIFRHSEFTKKIDNSSASILNSHVRVFLSKDITIDPTSYANITVKYGSTLTVDDNIALASYAVTSTTPWEYNGVQVYLADKEDPTSHDKRILYTYSKYPNGSTYVVNDNVGSIVLSSGILTLSPLGISDDTINLSIDLIPISDDVVSKRNQIVKINVNRCNVFGYVDEIAVGGTSRSINYQTFKRDR